ncbi:MAG TPA: MlaD family protein [Solirubrobacteraceae bacterium]|nr:MlaD family protein [Solirubrobacteraceae bacterium]
MRRKKRRRKGMSLFAAGAIGILAIVVFSYAAYTKFANPFASHYTVHAIFANANGLQADSLVRVAGVNVGKVTAVSTEPGCKTATTTATACNTADVTMEIDSNGLPIHKDATFAIRPRIFLEGNFFVDVSPGTPNAPIAGDGYTFPVGQGIEPVQLDQVLTGLQADTRKNLQTLLQQYGKAVRESGTAYNRSIQYWLPAYEYSSLVAHDALGIQPHDLSNYIAAQGTAAGAIDHNPPALKSLVTDFNTTAFAFAREQGNLRATVAELPKTLTAAIPAFNALNSAFPPLRRLARALLPGVRSTGPTVDASLPFITQLRLLVQPSELRGLTHDLSPTVPALAKLTQESIPLFKNQVRPASSCAAHVILPWTHLTVPDSHFNASNGFPARQVYVEGVDYLPGLAGESRVFDANGPYIRILGVGGTLTYSLSPHLFGQSLAPLSSVQPQLPPNDARPAYNETIPCETQKAITDLSAPSGPPMSALNGNGNGTGLPLPNLPIPSLPLPLQRRALAARNQEKQSAADLMSIIKKTAAADGLKVRLVPGMPK